MLETEAPKRRKKALIPPEGGQGDGARRKMDEFLMSVWQERFTEQGQQIDELTRTVRGFNGTPGVMERLTRIETSQADLVVKVNAIHLLLSRGKTSDEAEESKSLTLGKLAIMALKFSNPVLTAILIWALLTFFPRLIAQLGP